MNKPAISAVTTILGIAIIGGASFFYSQPVDTVAPIDALTIEERRISLIAVGDIMLSRNVAQKIKTRRDINYPFLKVRDQLKSADIVFANLENPITPGPDIKTGQMIFHATPGVEKALRDAGITIVSLANNHTPNFGQRGLVDTFRLLREAGIRYVGAGNNFEEARKHVTISTNGLRVAFLAYNDRDVVPASYQATAKQAGTAFMDMAELQRAVKAAKQESDFVIVSMHSGTEYKKLPNANQKKFAHAAIDAGAEMVIGHHPHVVQTMEEYKGKYIFYSLGNFIFDQMWSQDTREGIGLNIILTNAGVEAITFLPLQIDDYSQPRWLSDGAQAQRILNRLQFPAITTMTRSLKKSYEPANIP